MSTANVPVAVQVPMAHAWLQYRASALGVDILHVKGPAIDEAARQPGRASTDADVIVRPGHLTRFMEALLADGWRPLDHFETGSSFEHSATLTHPTWGLVDVHRRYPGFSVAPDEAFEILWRRRYRREIAEVPCDVPDVVGQILVVLLHAARAGGRLRAAADVEASWGRATAEQREQVEALTAVLGAELPLAIALGRDLTPFLDRPDFDLWRVAATGGTRLEEWRARIKAAPSRREALRIALRAPLVNRDNLAVRLGHQPSSYEVASEFFSRLWRGFSMEWRRARRPR